MRMKDESVLLELRAARCDVEARAATIVRTLLREEDDRGARSSCDSPSVPEYPKIESEAKLLAEELGLQHEWKDVKYKDASEQDQEKIRIAIEDEDVIPCNGDWAVKLGINLYYSVSLSQSPLFRKQLPYNEVIYKSFSQKSPTEQNSSGTIARRQKKIIFAGRWCGKVWMSNQVHPYLADHNSDYDDDDAADDDDGDDDDDDDIDLSLESDSYRVNGSQSILYKRKSSIKKAADRRKSSKKRTKSGYIESTTKPSLARLDNSSDGTHAEDNYGYAGNTDADTDTVKSETDTDIDNDKQAVLPGRNSGNSNAVARRKSDKKKLAVRSSNRKLARTRLKNSSDSGNADGNPDTDKSESNTDMEDDKQMIHSRRNSTNKNASARRKAQNLKKSAVILYIPKRAHTMPDNSSDPKYAKENSGYTGSSDGDQDTDKSHTDIDIKNNGRTIVQRRHLKNDNAAARRCDTKRKSSAARSRSRKPANTLLEDSSDAGSEEENTENADDDQNRDQSSEASSDSENKKQASLPRRNIPNNNAAAMKKSGKKRKRSKTSCNRKAAHSRPDSSTKIGYSEENPSIKCGRRLSRLRSSLKGTNRESPSIRHCSGETTVVEAPKKHNNKRKIKKALDSVSDKGNFSCVVEGCGMSFRTKHDLALHNRNVCPEKGCGKKFFSHKYLLQHRKVHSDVRPLKCPWKGCKMTFKWAWARTEHIRVHTGERPYSCREPGCDLTFRFVSDFSRHRRKTGH